MLKKIKNLVVQEEGQALTEYGLILAIVGVVVAGSLILLKNELVSVFSKVIAKLQ
ncbi:Flp family type IVb pilin [Paenibacillus sp. BSR1-1]|uniref:Flp family type IVb pilin n=1 Tax=Paenibacillus sp. BSR1-1 TaxID=3020845 RepID=UPI0025AF44B3|nr:Flp family type IVb pilin [Paenibacillus sp. BSR1-1]MDN3019729.1 Flp family type IVb pilin [Paenibacillus sp. BSR1-1]